MSIRKISSNGHNRAARAVHMDDVTRAVRNAIATGSTPLPHAVDGRSGLARRYRSIAAQLIHDQGEDLGEARLALVQRFAGCCVLAEQIETNIITGQPVKTEEYSQLISSLVRIANRIGLDRIPKTVSPNLKDYLHQRSDVIDADAEADE